MPAVCAELADDSAKTPVWRVMLGAIAGPLGAWLYVVGFWQLYLALDLAVNRWHSSAGLIFNRLCLRRRCLSRQLPVSCACSTGDGIR